MRIPYRLYLPFLAYLALTLLLLAPVLQDLSSAVIGEGGDPWQTLWRFEYKDAELREAYASSDLFGYIASEFFGNTDPHLVNLSVWPWMPFHWIFGQPLGYNIVWILSMAMAGYAMYLLVYTLMKPYRSKYAHVAAFLSGVLYMMLPYRIAHAYGHFGAMQTQWIPLIILSTLLVLKRPTTLRVSFLSILLVFQVWIEHHYMLWLAMAGLIVLPYIYKHRSRLLARRALFSYAIGSIILLFGFFSVLPTLRLSAVEDSFLDLGRQQTIRYSANPLAFITPAPFHPLWGDVFYERISGQFDGNISEATHYAGLSVLFLILFLHRSIPRRQKIFWGIFTFFFFVISLGPYLHGLGRISSIPLPYALIDSLPVISSVRTVGRASIMAFVGLCILFAFALRTKRIALLSVICIVLIGEFLFAIPVQKVSYSGAYRALEEMPGSRVIEIPVSTDYVVASQALWASARHRKESVGNISLERAMSHEDFHIATLTPGVRQLLYSRTKEMEEGRREFFNQDIGQSLRDAMRWLDVSAIIMHTNAVPRSDQDVIHSYLKKELAFTATEFDDRIVYVPQYKDYKPGVLVMRSEGWDTIQYDEETDNTFASFSDEAYLTLINTRNDPVRLRVEWETERGRPGIVYVNDHPITTFDGDENVSFEFDVESGQHVFEIRAGGTIIRNPSLSVID